MNAMGRPGITRTKIVFCALLAMASVCSAIDVSNAFQQKDLDKLLTTRQCEWCDLRRADLSGSKLSGARLGGAALSNANLSNADLSGANMRSTYMYGANLTGANLSRAKLDKANLREAELSGVNLLDASLSETMWRNRSRCLEGSVGECKGDPSRQGTSEKGIGF